MNILYYFKDYENNMSKWQYIHIIDELERHGHKITVYNPLSFNTIEESNEKLIPYIKSSGIKFDLFLNCESSGFLFPESVKEVSKIGLPTALICFDNLHAPHIHKSIAPLFDVVWLTSFETINMFEKWGCRNIIFQPYAANPYQFTPHWNKKTIQSVCFIGSPYGSRVEILNTLTQAGVNCEVYTDTISSENKTYQTKSKVPSAKKEPVKDLINSLSFSIGRKVFISAALNRTIFKEKTQLDTNKNLLIKPSVSFEEMQEIYSNNALSLNITVLRNTYLLNNPVHKIHLRTFEIPMCGGLQLAPYSDELASYFEDNKEIVLYKNTEEFISKAKFYLAPENVSLSKQMKQAARKRAENEHTWNIRFNNLFQKI